MSEWRFFACRVIGDGTTPMVHSDLPLTVDGLTDVLSGPLGLSGSIKAAYKGMKGDDGEALFLDNEYGLAIFAERDGDIMPGGGLLTSALPNTDGGLEIECSGYAGYPDGMPYVDSNSWTGIDTLDAYRHIWEHLQSKPNGNLGLTIGGERSGVLLGTVAEDVQFTTAAGESVAFEAGPYKLNWWKDNDLQKAISDLRDAARFDFHERHFWEGEVLRHHLDLGVPRLGVRRDDFEITVGVNVATRPSYSNQMREYASGVLVLGAGEGREMIRGEASRPTSRLRRVAVVSDKRLQTNLRAYDAARRDLAGRVSLPAVSEVTVTNRPDLPIAGISLGDEVPYRDDTNPWFSVDTYVRVIASTINPKSDDRATLTVVRTDLEET